MKENNNSKPKKESPEKRQPLNSYVKYTTIVFQMIAMIAIGTGIGMWLDEKFETETPWWTLGLSLFAVFAALFTTLREHIGK